MRQVMCPAFRQVPRISRHALVSQRRFAYLKLLLYRSIRATEESWN